MKNILIAIAALLISSVAWMAMIREPLPEIPEIIRPLSEEVPFDFQITSMTASSVEMGLRQKVSGRDMFVKFSMSNAFKTGRPGLILNGLGGRKSLSGGMSAQKYLQEESKSTDKKKGFGDFMRDRRGRSVTTYKLNQMLEEGRDGKTYMLVAHNGPDMNLIQTLEIPRPVTLPKYISQKFTDKGIIQFRPGKVAFDNGAKGFHIPVEIR